MPLPFYFCSWFFTSSFHFTSLPLKYNHLQDEATRLTAMTWIKDFVEMANGKLVEQYPSILGTVLANISHQNRDIVQVGGVERGW